MPFTSARPFLGIFQQVVLVGRDEGRQADTFQIVERRAETDRTRDIGVPASNFSGAPL